ncbi:MAG: protoheme IX farnesyltransferase [Myxococcales bacterium]|nr:protoheme IX farnesyltransferase [Myxococcales bacterium]
MSSAQSASAMSIPAAQPAVWRDYLTLTKPRITAMCVMMTAGGYWLAIHRFSWLHFLWAMLGTTLVVGGSCALNMYAERENDKKMRRTAMRPLPAGRMAPWKALVFGIGISLVGTVILALGVNLLTAVLALVALFSYVGLYTPLKRKTSLFLLIGTIPGAIPPLMGWTAAAGAIELPGVMLFLVLLAWQLPHFLALSLVCEQDYEKGGIQIVSLVRGERNARFQALFYTVVLLGTSLALVPFKIAGWFYFVAALGLGLWFLQIALQGLSASAPKRWPYRFFYASLIYLPALTGALMIDAVIRFSYGA